MPIKDEFKNIDDSVNGGFVNTGQESSQDRDSSFFKEVAEIEKQIQELDIKMTLEYANMPVNGYEDFTRFEYAKEAVRFRSEPDERRNRPAVPESLQNSLREMIPGWIAQESRFKGDLVSKSGATGIAQIKPVVWEEYKGTRDVSLRMDEQMEVFGELVSDNYHYILHFAGKDTIDTLRNRFDSEDDFNRDLMIQLMLNAYNAGGPLMGRVLKSFVESTPLENLREGKELFLQIKDFALKNQEGYEKEQEEYVSRVYAMRDALSRDQV